MKKIQNKQQYIKSFMKKKEINLKVEMVNKQLKKLEIMEEFLNKEM